MSDSEHEQEDQEIARVKEVFESSEISAFSEALHEVIEIRSDSTIIDAFSLLVKSDIYAAPIRDLDKLDTKDVSELYAGILSLADFVAFILRVYENTPKWEKGMLNLLEEVATEKSHKNVMTLFTHDDPTPFVPITIDSSLRAAFRLMGHHHVHRLMVVDSNSTRPVSILTQSALVRVVESHLDTDYLRNISKRTIQDLGLAAVKHQLLFAKSSDPLLTAFELLHKHRISGVPIVNEDGTLAGNVSIKDIRELIRIPHSFPLMVEPITTFFEARKNMVGKVADAREKAEKSLNRNIFPIPGACTVAATFGDIIRHLSLFGMHRVFVVNAERKPLRVISLTDILDLFA